MKLSEFIGLSDNEKRATVMTHGVAVAKRYLPAHMAFLFQFPEYYVETLCSHESKEIQEYNVFQDTRHLSPYLELIAIDHLLS